MFFLHYFDPSQDEEERGTGDTPIEVVEDEFLRLILLPQPPVGIGDVDDGEFIALDSRIYSGRLSFRYYYHVGIRVSSAVFPTVGHPVSHETVDFSGPDTGGNGYLGFNISGFLFCIHA